MYKYLSVCEAAHPDFIESLILGTTAWKASRNKGFERALGDFQSVETIGMGVHYSTQVTTGGEGLSYAQLEEVIDKMRIHLEHGYGAASSEIAEKVDRVFLPAGQGNGYDDDQIRMGSRRHRGASDEPNEKGSSTTKNTLLCCDEIEEEGLKPAMSRWFGEPESQEARHWSIPGNG